jgi:hypothetical protein
MTKLISALVAAALATTALAAAQSVPTPTAQPPRSRSSS